MRITILNGNPDSGNMKFEEKLNAVSENWQAVHEVNIVNLREMNINYCTGCFNCWVKTPGLCVFKDDSLKMCKAAINCELLIFASPIIMGFTSALLKTATDKLIPLLHPYMLIAHGECHHRKRYDRYPNLGLLLQAGPDTDDEDLSIITNIYQRLSLNFHSEVVFNHMLDDTLEAMDQSLEKEGVIR